MWGTLLTLPVLAVGAVVFVAIEARERLPSLLAWVARELVPGLELRVGNARLPSLDRFVADRVVVGFRDADGPFFTADRIEVAFGLRDVWERRIAAVRLEGPEIRWVPSTRGELGLGSSDGGAPEEGELAWTVERLIATGGRAEVEIPPTVPEVAFEFELELDVDDLGTDAARDARPRPVRITNVRVGPEERPVLVAEEIASDLSLSGAAGRRLESLHVVRPRIDLGAPLPDLGGLDSDAAAPAPASEPTFFVGRLQVEEGRLAAPATSGRPGVAVSFSLDLRDLGDGPEVAGREHEVAVSDLRLTLPGVEHAAALSLRRASVVASVAGLSARRVQSVTLPEGEVLIDARARELLRADAGGPGGDAPDPADAWRIGTLDIGSLAVHLAELGPPVPDVTFDVHTTLADLPLSAAAAAIADERQQIELASLALYSPFDPFKKVVSIGSVFVDFSLGGAMRQRISRVKLLRPTIYLAEDLFWYMANERGAETSSPATPWTIDVFEAQLGSLILEIGSARRVGLPITFETRARDVKLDNLADLQLAAKLKVPEESYRFPDYDLNVDRVRGELQFDYPPGEGAENFVSTLYADSFEWKEYALEEAWVSLTFDPQGINGTFGGAGYDGYVNGGLTVPYDREAPWVGWLSASALDLKQVSEVVSAGAVEVTGPLDANVALTVAQQALETVDGELTLAEPGRLEITKLDESQIPLDWPSWQRDLAKSALDALRSFSYEKGYGTVHFAGGVGTATLRLAGPSGTRNLDVRYDAGGRARAEDGPDGEGARLDVRTASSEDEP